MADTEWRRLDFSKPRKRNVVRVSMVTATLVPLLLMVTLPKDAPKQTHSEVIATSIQVTSVAVQTPQKTAEKTAEPILKTETKTAPVTQKPVQVAAVTVKPTEKKVELYPVRRLIVTDTRLDKPVVEIIASFKLEVKKDINRLKVICQVGRDEYKEHLIELGSTVSYVAEDVVEPPNSKYHYEVNFLPQKINPILDAWTYP